MKLSSTISIILVCLTFLPGCRGGRKGTDALEQELRQQEKKIWLYTSYIEDYKRLLDDCRGENGRLRERLGDDPDDGPRRSRLRGGDAESGEGPDLQIPEIEIPMADKVSPDFGQAEDEEREDRAARDSDGRSQRETFVAESGRGRVPNETPESEVALSVPAAEVVIDADPRDVETLELNNFFTGGNNTDGVPGDEGISLLIETRNAYGDVVPPRGEIDISLLDPSASSEGEARVGRWRLTVQEVRERFRDVAVGKGVRLNLPWQGATPRREKLRLFVRHTSADGERIQADQEINIELPGRSAAERRRRLFAARTNGRRAKPAPSSQGSGNPNPGASSAPLWQGGTAAADTSATQPEQSQQPDPAEAGWSKSRRDVPTHPTPRRLSDSQRAKRSPVPRPERQAENPAARRGNTPNARSEKGRSEKRRSETAVSPEPKIAVRKPDASSPKATEQSQPVRPPERTTLKPRPWSPYR